MKSEVKILTDKALKLPPNARAYISEALLESLDFDEDFPISKEWISEIQKRCHEIDDGKKALISGEKVLSNLHNKYS